MRPAKSRLAQEVSSRCWKRNSGFRRRTRTRAKRLSATSSACAKRQPRTGSSIGRWKSTRSTSHGRSWIGGHSGTRPVGMARFRTMRPRDWPTWLPWKPSRGIGCRPRTGSDCSGWRRRSPSAGPRSSRSNSTRLSRIFRVPGSGWSGPCRGALRPGLNSLLPGHRVRILRGCRRGCCR